jgi:hypothetical protein
MLDADEHGLLVGSHPDAGHLAAARPDEEATGLARRRIGARVMPAHDPLGPVHARRAGGVGGAARVDQDVVGDAAARV